MFKKFLSTLMVFTLILSCICLSEFTSSAAETITTGDSNGDNVLSVRDVTCAQKHLAGYITLSDSGLIAADCDKSGDLTIRDVTFLQQYLVGINDVDNFCGLSCLAEQPQEAATVAYTNDSVTFKNSGGATVGNPSNIKLTNGTYLEVIKPVNLSVSGSCNNGQLAVNISKEKYPVGKIEIEMTGLTLKNLTDSAIYVEEIDDECAISAKNKTKNYITGGTSNSDTDPIPAIYAKDDIKFKGKGSLSVTGEEGISCKNDIKIWNSSLTVTSVGCAIKGKDSVRIGDPKDTSYTNLSVKVNSNDDGIKSSSGYVTVNGGDVTATVENNAVYGKNAVTIAGGTLTVNNCKEGIEGKTVTINGGTINITASDDGINASVSEGAENEKGLLTIGGGEIVINAGGDGIDANGSVVMTGGLLVSNGTESKKHGALDYDDEFTMSGGTVFALGNDKMAQTISKAQGVASIKIKTPSKIAENSLIALNDSDYNNLIAATITKKCNSIVYASSNLVKGNTYNLCTGGQITGGTQRFWYSTGGTYIPGTELLHWTQLYNIQSLE